MYKQDVSFRSNSNVNKKEMVGGSKRQKSTLRLNESETDVVYQNLCGINF